MSERVGIPLSRLLDHRTRQVVFSHHLLSPRKLPLMRAVRFPRDSDLLVALSRAEAAAFPAALSVAPGQITCILNAVDTRFFKPSRQPLGSGPGDHLLSVGLSYRDYPTLVTALRGLPDVACQVRAASPWIQRGMIGRERLDVPANVRFESMASPRALRSAYEESRFVVVPFRETTYASVGSTAVLEAQAMGKAVIATRSAGMPDYVRDGETGILVDQGDPAALAGAIRTLWHEPGRAAAMGAAARAWVDSEFPLERWLDQVVSLLSRALR
jgi:glycosyltransferase involved in cell wall biosynthesis